MEMKIYFSHRGERAEAGVSATSYAVLRQTVHELLIEVQRLREKSGSMQGAFDQLRERMDRFESRDLIKNRLRAVEQGQPRLEGQVDVLMRMKISVA